MRLLVCASTSCHHCVDLINQLKERYNRQIQLGKEFDDGILRITFDVNYMIANRVQFVPVIYECRTKPLISDGRQISKERLLELLTRK